MLNSILLLNLIPSFISSKPFLLLGRSSAYSLSDFSRELQLSTSSDNFAPIGPFFIFSINNCDGSFNLAN